MRFISEMVEDRNKLPIHQLIPMPSSNSTNYYQHPEVMMTSPKKCVFTIL